MKHALLHAAVPTTIVTDQVFKNLISFVLLLRVRNAIIAEVHPVQSPRRSFVRLSHPAVESDCR
jgi:hypothetical protein